MLDDRGLAGGDGGLHLERLRRGSLGVGGVAPGRRLQRLERGDEAREQVVGRLGADRDARDAHVVVACVGVQGQVLVGEPDDVGAVHDLVEGLQAVDDERPAAVERLDELVADDAVQALELGACA